MLGSQVIAIYVQLSGHGCGAHEHGGGGGGGGGPGGGTGGAAGVTEFDAAEGKDETP